MSEKIERRKYMENFEKVYKDLNPQQKKAVDTIEGPVLVIAGPGTGKTQVLTARIANILLKTDTPSRAILALTFTESGVKAMKERLLTLIGPEAYYVNITTFHSFCSDVIKDNPDKFIIAEDLEPLSELERIQIFREILDEGPPAGGFEALRPFGGSRYYYVRALIKNIQDLKREGISPEDLTRAIKGLDPKGSNPIGPKDFDEKDVKKNEEMVEVYKKYQEKLTERSRFDFEDMINLVVEAFKNDGEFLKKYQERFQYILVDEFQDTNSPQNQVIRQLADYWGEAANIFAVGDDQQSIYRFQGASLENILYFKNLYPKAEVVTLKENYRSTQKILDAAHELIDHNRARLADHIKGIERRLISKRLPESELRPQGRLRESGIQVGHFSSGITESYFVAAKIKELIEKGTDPSKIAVLYRHNADAADVSDTLARLNISFDLQAGVDVLQDFNLEKLFRLLEVILKIRRKDEDVDLFTLFNYEFLQKRFGFEYLDTLKLCRLASDHKVNFFEAITHPEFVKNKVLHRPEVFIDFVNKLLDWQKQEANQTFVSFFEVVINESGYLDWILALPNSVEVLNRLNSLFAEIKRLNNSDHRLNLEKFFEDLNVLKDSHIVISEHDLDIHTNSVVLTTAHGAKGLEFDYVFIVKCLDGKFGNNKTRQLIKLPPNLLNLDVSDSRSRSAPAGQTPGVSDANEDERRLFYVALTRARRGVFITHADVYPSDSSSRENIPSQFLSEISEDKKEILPVARYEGEVKKILAEVLKPLDSTAVSVEEGDFLRTVLMDFRLSVTALNTYLECPYKFKLNTLLRTPRAKDAVLSFGSAVHKALEMMMRKFKSEGRLPGYQYLLDQFEAALIEEVMTQKDYEDFLKKGKKFLRLYYEFYKNELVRPLFTEKFFGYGFSKIYLGDIPLTGKVDRIDPLSSGRQVKVVDYKTGKPRTRNEIEGKNKNGDSGYKRQLVFYKLLADLDQAFNYEVVEAELDFVEGREGKFVKHSFVISKEETEELKRIIKEVMAKIRNLEFPRTTKYDVCTYCEFKAHCWPENIPSNRIGQLSLVLDSTADGSV